MSADEGSAELESQGFGSYCDEFGHPKDSNKHFMGIAGLLAWSDEWIGLTKRWRAIQKAEYIPNPFHMADFVHHNEDFSDIRRLHSQPGYWLNGDSTVRQGEG